MKAKRCPNEWGSHPCKWKLPSGDRLKFQDGDHVRIDTSRNPAQMLPFTSGCVRGYNLCEQDGEVSVAYELHRRGHHPIQWVKEEVLEFLCHNHTRITGCTVCGYAP